ncbi:MAG: pyrimidine-nucleoside phosphorylase [Clostridiales bacterium]|nr:pyrimidine-nucleoside phosphorylase [Clostridiales bacterium]
MRAYDLILKKRNGKILEKEEIDFFINGFVNNEIPDYQVSALLMAIYFNGLTKRETIDLTMAIVNSGDIIDLSEIQGITVDKHSTGGVGDKISLVVLPLVSSLGIPVAKISGRGLGHTGGTIDKLESIEGFKTQLSKEKFVANVNKYKMAITSQSADITPGDRKLYALRDVTATVDSIPLIASSIMSKKIASGAMRIVLDVKVGSGAFLKTIDEAKELARLMVDIGNGLNRKTFAVITDMNQPLGYEVGNANEIKEAVKVLSGQGAVDETTVALTIASYMAILGGAFDNFDIAYRNLQDLILSGTALNKFKELIVIQGGRPDFIDDFNLLPQSKYNISVKSDEEGYVNSINAEKVGLAAMMLGAGRKTKNDLIDHSAGITMIKKVGDRGEKNEELCILHTNFLNSSEAAHIIKKSYVIEKEFNKKMQYIYDIIQ